jgi:hypothetical protein
MPRGVSKFIIFLALSVLFGLIYNIPSRIITFKLENTNTIVKIVFGNLFKQDGHKIISVNEFFDSKIGDNVSPNSLHGVFIQKILGGHSDIFNQLVDKDIQNEPYEIIERANGRNKRYSIGTTSQIEYNGYKYFLFAFCRTNLTSLKAEGNVQDMWVALDGLWRKVRIYAGGTPVNIPVVGSGLSGVGLPINHLIQIILMSILKATKEREITSQICIVINESLYEEVEIDIIKTLWR